MQPLSSEEAKLERAGSHALSIFARVLSVEVLRAHVEGPLGAGELGERLGWAPEASLRVATSNLRDLGALVRQGRERTASTELTAAGHDLFVVADALEGWLAESPFGSLDLSEGAARGTVRALVASWEATIVRALAQRPHSLAELSREISGYSYPTLKRRLAKLRTAALVAPIADRGRSPAFEVTPWLRQATGVLGHAARWERDHLPGVPSLEESDLETTLLLAAPLANLSPKASGSCVLAAPMARGRLGDEERQPGAVSVVVEEGRVVSLDVGATSNPSTWALGSVDAWLNAIVEGRLEGLRIRGADADLAASLLGSLTQSLFQDGNVKLAK